jgi:hypothetical protein
MTILSAWQEPVECWEAPGWDKVVEDGEGATAGVGGSTLLIDWWHVSEIFHSYERENH